MRMSALLAGVTGCLTAFGSMGCFVDLDELTGGAAADRGTADEGAAGQGGQSGVTVGGVCNDTADCSSPLVCEEGRCSSAGSCLELLQKRPTIESGRYELSYLTAGAPRVRQCDMQTDGGGWTRLTAQDVKEELLQLTTSTLRDDADLGLVVTVYANSPGCADAKGSQHVLHFDTALPWQAVRFRQLFAGAADCFSIFGGEEMMPDVASPGLSPFNNALDVARDEVRMGVGINPATGTKNDAFNGQVDFCSNLPIGLWKDEVANEQRSAVVILRRRNDEQPSGLGTGVTCNTSGEGTTSPTWWRYSEIYVR